MKNLLPKILAVITRHPRELVIAGEDFEWSSLWSVNAFRLFEILFGRREGRRKETHTFIINEGGKITKVIYSYTWEAIFATVEDRIRQSFKTLKLTPVRVSIPLLMTPDGFPILESKYLFAIAFDQDTFDLAHTASFTESVTVTGSNPTLFCGSYCNKAGGGDLLTGITYNSISLTQITKGVNGASSDEEVYVHGLAGCATGSNTLSITITGTVIFFAIHAASYSGTDQSGTWNFHNTLNQTSNPAIGTITVAGTNSWVAGPMGCNPGQVNIGTITTATPRGGNLNRTWADSNATVSSGSNSFSIGNSGANNLSFLLVEVKVPAGGGSNPKSITSDLIFFN